MVNRVVSDWWVDGCLRLFFVDVVLAAAKEEGGGLDRMLWMQDAYRANDCCSVVVKY